MCGICGIFDFSASPQSDINQHWVQQMNQKLKHRGPDETSFWNDQTAFLGFQRLSIIDLHTGSQPIFNEDQTVGVIFNGEIYNFAALKEDLQKKGHRFATHTDTEVLVHLYESYGTDMVSHLKGMFAFCLYDLNQKKAFFARDRFGEKPFYYYYKNGLFAFASELNALLQFPEISRKLNREGLVYFLKMGMQPGPSTLFQEIHSLPPGHQLSLDADGVRVTPYFQPQYRKDPALRTAEDVSSFLYPLLQNAVKRQMRTDVPLGAFLSGGIDSSTIVALCQEQASESIKTFTVRFQDSSYDESPIARKVAERLGTDHHEITIPPGDFNEENFWKVIDHTGLPFTDTSAIPTYFITREIRKHVTVALSGDGGDEVFAGYPIFHWWKKIHQLKAIPEIFRQAGKGTLNGLARVSGLRDSSTLRQVRKALDISLLPSDQIPMEIMQVFEPDFLDHLKFSKGSDPFSHFTNFMDVAAPWSSLRQIMYFRLRYNLALNLLPKVDRMSMANSLEVRAPFLDVDLFEAAAQIPDHLLMHRGQGKLIIREMMKNRLPEEVFNHPKMGFAIPLHRYMNGSFHELVARHIRQDHPLNELLQWEEVQKIKEMGLDARKDSAQMTLYKATARLWVLLALYAWVDRFAVEV